MKIYYYHTRPIEEALGEWEKHLHPGPYPVRTNPF